MDRPKGPGSTGRPKVLIAAEGNLDEGANRIKRGAFAKLWEEIVAALCTEPEVHVVGFNKNAILALDEASAKAKNLWRSNPPLDVLIADRWRTVQPVLTVVAFDLSPPNQLLPSGGRCREVLFVLQRFSVNDRLPQPLVQAASRLLTHYAPLGAHGPVARRREPLEILCMEPEFEALPAHDEAAIRRALSIGRAPKDWPWNAARAAADPKALLSECVAFHVPRGASRPARGRFCDNVHGWSLEFVKAARALGDRGKMFDHPIAKRLKDLTC